MKNYDAPSGYTLRDSGLYGFVDVLDFVGNVLASSVSIGAARASIADWQAGKNNPYLTLLGVDTR